MSKEERKLLHEWVKNGNSPYENGDYVCDDNCQPMDFVNTLRFWEEMNEYNDSLTEEENRASASTPEYALDKKGFDIPADLLDKIEKKITFL